jgi:dsDNA-specific endonuclease/ATPase MutS2
MGFSPDDLVHVAALGKGIVRERRNRERYVVEIKGRSIVVAADQLTAFRPARRSPNKQSPGVAVPAVDDEQEGGRTNRSLDLHGKTVNEAIDALDEFLNIAILEGDAGVLIIHGRSGGRIKTAVHARLSSMPSIRGFRVDPRNQGVTIVKL